VKGKLMGLFDLFSNNTAETAADQRNQGLQAGYNQLSGLYGAGRDAINTNYGNASGLYSNLINSSAAGANAYGDASGANGAAGYGRATANFQANPGYQFQMDQGVQALDRTHAAAGNLSSGNADADTLKFATGLANQSYGGYLAGLQPYLGQQSTATQGGATIDALQGNALNTNLTGQGTAANANQTAQGASSAAATMNNYNVGANQLGGLLGLGSLAAGGIGGAGGLGGLTGGFGGSGFSLGPTSVGGAPVSGGLFSMFK
jgi:hypothetical protein